MYAALPVLGLPDKTDAEYGAEKKDRGIVGAETGCQDANPGKHRKKEKKNAAEQSFFIVMHIRKSSCVKSLGSLNVHSIA